MSLVVFDHVVQLVHFAVVHLHVNSPENVSCVRLHFTVREPFRSRKRYAHQFGREKGGQRTESDASYVSLTTTVTVSHYRGGSQ